jgi:hypothetical protein
MNVNKSDCSGLITTKHPGSWHVAVFAKRIEMLAAELVGGQLSHSQAGSVCAELFDITVKPRQFEVLGAKNSSFKLSIFSLWTYLWR